MSIFDRPPSISKTVLVLAVLTIREAISADDAAGRRQLHAGLFDGYCLSCFEAVDQCHCKGASNAES